MKNVSKVAKWLSLWQMPLLISVLRTQGDSFCGHLFLGVKYKIPPDGTLFFPFDLGLSFEMCNMSYFHQWFDKEYSPTLLSSRWSQGHFIHIYAYMYVCIYNFIRITINPIALEWIVSSTLAEFSKNLTISLCMRNEIILWTRCILWCWRLFQKDHRPQMSKYDKNISDTLAYSTCDTLFCFHHILTHLQVVYYWTETPGKIESIC